MMSLDLLVINSSLRRLWTMNPKVTPTRSRATLPSVQPSGLLRENDVRMDLVTVEDVRCLSLPVRSDTLIEFDAVARVLISGYLAI